MNRKEAHLIYSNILEAFCLILTRQKDAGVFILCSIPIRKIVSTVFIFANSYCVTCFIVQERLIQCLWNLIFSVALKSSLLLGATWKIKSKIKFVAK